MSAPPENDHGHKQPWHTKILVSAGVVVGVVLLTGLTLAVRPLLSDTSSPEQASQEPAPPSEAPLADADLSVCGLEPSEGAFEDFPAGTSWDYVGIMQVPSHEDHGPGLLSDEGVPGCWANSAEGAVNAALAYGALSNDVELALPAAEQMLAQGQGRESALGGLREQGPQVERGEFRGVRVLSFDSDRALVDIAFVVGDLPSGPPVSSVVDLRWEDGDWRVATRDNGSMTVPPSMVSDPSDYIPVGPEA